MQTTRAWCRGRRAGKRPDDGDLRRLTISESKIRDMCASIPRALATQIV